MKFKIFSRNKTKREENSKNFVLIQLLLSLHIHRYRAEADYCAKFCAEFCWLFQANELQQQGKYASEQVWKFTGL